LISSQIGKIKSAIHAGIPNSLRGQVWPVLANVDQLKKESKLSYSDLLSKKETPGLEYLEKDIARTFPNHELFQNSGGKGQQMLKNILVAISLAVPEMCYCQGENFVAAFILMHCKEEDAFWIMLSLMKDDQIVQNYINPSNLSASFRILDVLIEQKLPKIATILKDHNAGSQLFFWYLDPNDICFNFTFANCGQDI